MRKNKLKFLCALFLVGAGVPVAAQAASLQDVINAINLLRVQISTTVITTAEAVTNLLYEFNPSAPLTLASDIKVPQITQAVQQTGATLNQRAVTQQLATVIPSEYQQYLTESNFASLARPDELRNLSQTLEQNPKAIIARLIPGGMVVENKNEINPNNVEALTGSISFAQNSTEANKALQFINYVADTAQPLTTLKPEDLAKIKDPDKNPKFLEYIITLRSMVAARSVALNNFYRNYAERVITKGLGAQVGLPDGRGGIKADASPLEVRDYMASRRITDPEWHKQMAAGSMHTLLNELVAIEAENRYEMHELRKDIARLNTALSVIELKALKIDKLSLMQLEGDLKTPAVTENAAGAETPDKTTLEKAEELSKRLKEGNR